MNYILTFAIIFFNVFVWICLWRVGSTFLNYIGLSGNDLVTTLILLFLGIVSYIFLVMMENVQTNEENKQTYNLTKEAGGGSAK